MIRIGLNSPVFAFKSNENKRTDTTPGIARNSEDVISWLKTETQRVNDPNYTVTNIKSGSKGSIEDQFVRLEREGKPSQTLSIKSGISSDDSEEVRCFATVTDESKSSEPTGVEYIGSNKEVMEEANNLLKAIEEKKQQPEQKEQNCLLPFKA